MKTAILSLILQVLYRTMRVLEKRDAGVAADMAQLPEGTCVRIRAGLSSGAPQMTVARQAGRLVKGSAEQRADIEITFKSVSGAFRVFTGCESIAQAYSQHRFALSGNINETMCLVRAIETAEGYLFPRVWNKRILKFRVKKQIPTLAVYGLVLCGKA